jgi:hypothetical protein
MTETLMKCNRCKAAFEYRPRDRWLDAGGPIVCRDCTDYEDFEPGEGRDAVDEMGIGGSATVEDNYSEESEP